MARDVFRAVRFLRNVPRLKNVERVLRDLSDRFELSNARADEDGRFESITIMSPDDYAALDISFESGEEVLEQGAALDAGDEILGRRRRGAGQAGPAAQVRRPLRPVALRAGDRRRAGGRRADEMLDPSALLIVLDALVELTGGVGVDPQSGTLL